jgi:argininosuccinate synthase
MRKKAVLAYSGGLDTSILIRILQERYDHDVIAVHLDIGEGQNAELLEKRARSVGAIAFEAVDAREELARDFIAPIIVNNARYEGIYSLNSAISRPLIARHLVRVAREHGAQAVAHGSTGKGNDQVRFDLSTRSLAPDLAVLAPQREHNMTRDDALEYAQKHGIEVPVTRKSPYSIDANIWGRSIEGGVIEDPSQAPPRDVWQWTADPDDCPAGGAEVTLGFEQGLPVSLDGQAMPLHELVVQLNTVAGQHGVGRIDSMENRLVGIKTRELYEAPAAEVLLRAHHELERLVNDGRVARLKASLDLEFARLVYEGHWFHPLMDAIGAFSKVVNERCTGEVTVLLHRGASRVSGRRSEYMLYDYARSTYDHADSFDHTAAIGFIELFGMPLLTWRGKGPA